MIKFKNNAIFLYIILALCCIGSIIFVYNNYGWYEQPIAKITKTSIEEINKVTDQYDNKDKLFIQTLTAEVKNGNNKGKQVHLTNEYSLSGAYDQPYKTGNEVFISFDKDAQESAAITGVKRDKYTMMVAWVFIFALFIVGKKRGLFASISLAVNIILLSYALDIYVNTGMNLLWICGVLVILFTVISLLFVNGFNEKTYAAIISTLLGTFLGLLITYLVLWVTSENGLHYEEMQFLTRPYTLIFLAGLFIGSLGAVMDVAISISSAMFELYQKNKDIPVHTLKASGIDIGKDIMGTMTNILFFAYVSGSIPILILYISNRSPLGFTLSINLSLEVARALAGGIGIVITIPIGIYISIFLINRKKANS